MSYCPAEEMLQEAKKKETGHIHVNFLAGEGGRKERRQAMATMQTAQLYCISSSSS